MIRDLGIRQDEHASVWQIDTANGPIIAINDISSMRLVDAATGITRFVYRYQKQVTTYSELHQAMSTCETAEECRRTLLQFASQEEMAS